MLPLKEDGFVKDPMTISIPCSLMLANLSCLEASVRMATRLKRDFWRRNSSDTGRPMKPPAPMRRTDGDGIVKVVPGE